MSIPQTRATIATPDPILAELWAVKRELNKAADYRIDELARMAHETALNVERQWREQASGRSC